LENKFSLKKAKSNVGRGGTGAELTPPLEGTQES